MLQKMIIQIPEDTLPMPKILFSMLNISSTFNYSSCALVSGLLIKLYSNEENLE